MKNGLTNLESKLIDVNNRFTKFAKYTKKNLETIKNEVFRLTYAKPKNISKKSSCFLIVSDKNKKTYYGSGSIVKINGKFYIATNKHVVSENGEFLTIDKIYNNGTEFVHGRR